MLSFWEKEEQALDLPMFLRLGKTLALIFWGILMMIPFVTRREEVFQIFLKGQVI